MMDLIQLANFGEFIGGAAVLAALVYLAAQVRGSKRSTDFLVEQGVVAEFKPINVQIVGSKEVTNLYRRGVESIESLDPDERVQFDLLILEYMNIHHVRSRSGSPTRRGGDGVNWEAVGAVEGVVGAAAVVVNSDFLRAPTCYFP